MKVAIDIGTNTVLLLIAESSNRKIKVIHEEQRIPRLGKQVDENRLLHPDSIDRVLKALLDYKSIIETNYHEVESVIVTATSAVRDAKNRDTFIQKVKAETGFDIKLIEGVLEAEYTFNGALCMLDSFVGDQIVIDIGGGSTEIAVGSENEIRDVHSFDMGSVRFTERYIGHPPIKKVNLERAKTDINKLLEDRKFNIDANQSRLVGVAGTVTTLACLDLQLKEYDALIVNNYELSIERIQYWIEHFSSLTSAEIMNINPSILKGRADIIIAGLLILHEFMRFYDFRIVVVSTGGIRAGALLNH